MLALTLDIMIVLLLLISLGAGIRLYGALKILRVDGNEFQPMINSLDQATSRAENALRGLRKMAEDMGVKLSEEAKSTQRLLDELDFMTRRADQLAEKLDHSIGKARSAAPGPAAGSPSPDAPRTDGLGRAPTSSRRRIAELEQRLKNLR